MHKKHLKGEYRRASRVMILTLAIGLIVAFTVLAAAPAPTNEFNEFYDLKEDSPDDYQAHKIKVETVKQFTVIYMAADGYLLSDPSAKYVVYYENLGDTHKVNFNLFARDGYMFNGYSTIQGGNGEYYGPGAKTEVYDVIILYAMWARPY